MIIIMIIITKLSGQTVVIFYKSNCMKKDLLVNSVLIFVRTT